MNIILKEYLSSLKERDELDLLLVNLLRNAGCEIITSPSRGTRQFGVDICAVGEFDGAPKSILLLTVKSGDLTRNDWNSGKLQDVKPSLDEILNNYLRVNVQSEHKKLPVRIIVAFGGDLKENCAIDIASYFDNNKKKNRFFETWNGDKISILINKHLLNHSLLPVSFHSHLRKTLAFVDEPEIAIQHFDNLLKEYKTQLATLKNPLQVQQQLLLSLLILFSFSEAVNNYESVYVSTEKVLLLIWDNCKNELSKEKSDKNLIELFENLIQFYFKVIQKLIFKVTEFANIYHGLTIFKGNSNPTYSSIIIQDYFGRVALFGLWRFNLLRVAQSMEQDEQTLNEIELSIKETSQELIELINNNPIWLSPIKDENAIDIFLVFQLLYVSGEESFIKKQANEISNRMMFYYLSRHAYPSTISRYDDLVHHPLENSIEYRDSVTQGSILISTLLIWFAVLDDEKGFKSLIDFIEKDLSHCNIQYWIPDQQSEDYLYNNSEPHGIALSSLNEFKDMSSFLENLIDLTQKHSFFDDLSATKNGLIPLVFTACRHHRYPIPLNLLIQGYNFKKDKIV